MSPSHQYYYHCFSSSTDSSLPGCPSLSRGNDVEFAFDRHTDVQITLGQHASCHQMLTDCLSRTAPASVRAESTLPDDLLLKVGREAELLIGGAVEGGIRNGVARAHQHPWQFAGELLGIGALVVATRGNTAFRLPALAMGTLGGAAFLGHAYEAISAAVPAVRDTWNNRNVAHNRQVVEATLGPLLFDLAVMTVTGRQVGKLTSTIERLSLREPASAGNWSQSLARTLGLSRATELARSGPSPRHRSLTFINEPESVTAGRLVPVSNRQSGDPLGYRSQIAPNGDVLHDFENFVFRGSDGNQFPHRDGTVVFLGYQGRVEVAFPGSSILEVVDLRRPLRQVSIAENTTSGQTIYRFNGGRAIDLIVHPRQRQVLARLADGDHQISFDAPATGTLFRHTDSMQTQINPNGLLTFILPNSEVRQVNMGASIGRVRLIEHADGRKTFTFLDEQGQAHQHKVELPPLPRVPTPPPPAPRHFPRQTARSQPENAAPIGRSGAETRGETEYGGGAAAEDLYPSWRLGLPQSVHRGAVDLIAGIDSRAMPDNSMRGIADLGLGLQRHNWVIEDYLNGLGRGGDSSLIDGQF